MARTSAPDSATSQFFINVVDNEFLNKDKAQDKVGYAVFGKVVEGMDVVDKIVAVKTTEQGAASERAGGRHRHQVRRRGRAGSSSARSREAYVRSPCLLDRRRTALVLIDVQERYRRVLHGWDRVVGRVRPPPAGARSSACPSLVTEQYPQGSATPPRSSRATSARRTRRREAEPELLRRAGSSSTRSRALGRRQILVAGIETHACVNQTVHDLLARGYQVHVARGRDVITPGAATSRRPGRKMLAAGMLPTDERAGAPRTRRNGRGPGVPGASDRCSRTRGAGSDASAVGTSDQCLCSILFP